MRKGPRYEVHTKYGWFSLDEGAYWQSFLDSRTAQNAEGALR